MKLVTSNGNVTLTPEEHQARAMLLGRWYDVRTHSYRNDGLDALADADALDADTLELVTVSGMVSRLIKGVTGYTREDCMLVARNNADDK